MQTLIQVVCSEKKSLRDVIAHDDKLEKFNFYVEAKRKPGRSPGWTKIHSIDPHIMRFHLAGLNYFLPGSYQYICYTLPLPAQKDFRPLPIGFQSLFGGAFGTGGRVDQWPAAMKQQAAQHVQVHKRIRRFLMGDYYPLAVQSRDLEAWEAWQFHDTATDEGFVQAFRLNSPDSCAASR